MSEISRVNPTNVFIPADTRPQDNSSKWMRAALIIGVIGLAAIVVGTALLCTNTLSLGPAIAIIGTGSAFVIASAIMMLLNRTKKSPETKAEAPSLNATPNPEVVTFHIDEGQNLITQEKAMDALYAKILKDPTLVDKEEGDTLVRTIKEFEATHQEIPDPTPAEKTSLANIKNIKTCIYGLRALGFALKLNKEPGVDDKGELKVSPDGNCLFHAALVMLKSFGLMEPQDTHMTLRQKTIDYLITNQNNRELSSKLQEALASYKEAKVQQLKEIDRPHYVSQPKSKDTDEAIKEIDTLISYFEALDMQDYLVLAKQDKFFGTCAEVYAMAHLFNVTISVKYFFQGMPGAEEIFNENQTNQITLNFKQDAKHFDLQVY